LKGGGSFWDSKALPQRAAFWLLAMVGTAQRLRLRPSGMGFVIKVPGAQAPVKIFFSCTGRLSTRPNLLIGDYKGRRWCYTARVASFFL
jgi:hypothetical protein